VRSLLTLCSISLLAACATSTTNDTDGGNGTDYAPLYVGAWSGSADITADGNEITADAVIPIEEVSTNVIELQGLCSDSDNYAAGPQADVSSTGFSIVSDACSFASENCNQGNITFAWSDGNGSLTNGQLSFNVDGTLSCGTLSVSYTLTFSSSQKGPYGSLRSGQTPSAALAAAAKRAFR
jgi:hypothetical protein